MGAGHLKFGRSRMRGNNLLYEKFRRVNYGGSLLFETSLRIAFGLCSNLCWTRTDFSLLAYLFHPADL